MILLITYGDLLEKWVPCNPSFKVHWRSLELTRSRIDGLSITSC